MNRYLVKQEGKKLKLYFSSIKKAKEKYPKAEIELYEDNSFIEYVEKIQSLTTEVSGNWWKIPYSYGYIMYRQFKDEDGWLDGCEYIGYYEHNYTVPFMKTLTNPKDFYEKFFDDDVLNVEHGFKRLTKREFGKLKGKAKPVKFCTIEGVSWCVDGYGNFFEYESYEVNKKAVEEWKQFHDNSNAVYAQIWSGIYNKSCYQWYNSMDEFKADFEKKKDETPSYAATPRYEIIRIGYKKPHPYDRKNYIRLPYYPITKISKEERNEVKIYNSWKECAKGISYYKNGFYNDIHFEKVLRKYWEWVDKKNKV